MLTLSLRYNLRNREGYSLQQLQEVTEQSLQQKCSLCHYGTTSGTVKGTACTALQQPQELMDQSLQQNAHLAVTVQPEEV
jgi:hypothetical protein